MAEIFFLSDYLRGFRNDLEEITQIFIGEPFDYPQDVIDEIIDIADRVDLLNMKLGNIDYQGGFRYDD